MNTVHGSRTSSSRSIYRLDAEVEVSNILRYRHRGHLTDLDRPQVCNYGTSPAVAHAYAQYNRLPECWAERRL